MNRTAFEVKPDLIIHVVREDVDYLPNLKQPAMLMLHPSYMARLGLEEIAAHDLLQLLDRTAG